MQEKFSTHIISCCFAMIAIALVSVCAEDLRADEVLEGPVLARVERVIDGDTIAVKAIIWPGQKIHVLVRVNGIDTPEIKGKCRLEKKLAQFARRFVVNWTYSGWVKLKNIKRGKYAGRVIADVFNKKGYNLAEGLLKKNLAYIYSGGGKMSWCGRKHP